MGVQNFPIMGSQKKKKKKERTAIFVSIIEERREKGSSWVANSRNFSPYNLSRKRCLNDHFAAWTIFLQRETRDTSALYYSERDLGSQPTGGSSLYLHGDWIFFLFKQWRKTSGQVQHSKLGCFFLRFFSSRHSNYLTKKKEWNERWSESEFVKPVRRHGLLGKHPRATSRGPLAFFFNWFQKIPGDHVSPA